MASSPPFNVQKHITVMLNNEPPRPVLSSSIPPDCAPIYLALSSMWDGGELVLRSMRVRAPEQSLAMKEDFARFFFHYLEFMTSFTEFCNHKESKTMLRIAITDFDDALNKASDRSGALRAADAGFRFRDASFLALQAAKPSMEFNAMAKIIAGQEYCLDSLIFVAQGASCTTLGKLVWVARIIQGNGNFLAFPKHIKTYRRSHDRFVRKCCRQLREFIAYHQCDTWGIIRHIVSPHVSLRRVR